MAKDGFVSRVHRKMPKGRSMPEATRRANNAKSKIRSRIEHVFAAPKDRMDLFIRTIGIARATTKIGMANLVYDIKRLLFLRRLAEAWLVHRPLLATNVAIADQPERNPRSTTVNLPGSALGAALIEVSS